MKAKEFQEKLKSGEIIVGAKGRLMSRALNSQIMQNNFNKPKEKIANRKRVDINLQPITIPIAQWRKDHPDEIFFDSLIEGQFYHFLKEHNIPFQMKVKIEIQPSFDYLGKKIQPITWSPDFAIKNTFQPIIIDTKGYPNDSFPMKYKMVLHHFHKISVNKNIARVPHIWFVNTKSKFIIALQCINRVLNDQELNGLETSLLFGHKKKKKK